MSMQVFRPIANSIAEFKNLDFSQGFLDWFASSEKIGSASFSLNPEGGVKVLCHEGDGDLSISRY
ncbi:hypothetical protein KEJ14_05485 [Candidatus Bathyarchaeota archaeon]|nr:hypothetical protein [Candidatus Bathyarchaeota archaeon]